MAQVVGSGTAAASDTLSSSRNGGAPGELVCARNDSTWLVFEAVKVVVAVVQPLKPPSAMLSPAAL